jgi:hypothetical protein
MKERSASLALAPLAAMLAVGAALLLVAAGTARADENSALLAKVQYLSGMPMLIAADQLGVDEIEGKSLANPGGSPPGNAQAPKLTDVGIGTDPVGHENEPSVAANPKNKKMLVAGSHFFPATTPGGVDCVAYTSSDGGNTWSAGVVMPQLTPGSGCSDPVLAYSSDGSRVYYAYMDIKGIDYDIVVNYSDDNGATWLPVPVIALNGNPVAFIYDKPWISTPQDDPNYVYVTATQFDITGAAPDHIAFTRSSNAGASYSAVPTLLDSAVFPAVVQGSRPEGGKNGEVLVAWYNSTADGWLAGSFQIRTRLSSDNGATFDPINVAATDSFELPFWLGPFIFYHRWWGGMFPDVELTPGGSAHIVYTHDPVAGSANEEDGDIRYVTSSGPPYTSWSSPVTVNDDGMVRAQGYAALDVQYGGQASVLNAMWEDHRLSPTVPIAFPNSSNLYYDQFYSRKIPGVPGWMENLRVSDVSSIVDFVFIGDYVDLTSSNKLFGIWTDRRDKLSIFDFEDDVFGSEIIPGGGTP